MTPPHPHPERGRGAGLAYLLALWLALSSSACDTASVVEAAGPPAPEDEPEPLATSVREALQDGVRYLGRNPELLQLDPLEHPPLVEAFRRDGAMLRLQYRQELEMAYGSLVSVYRGVLIVGEGDPLHRVANGPAPNHWTSVSARAARQLWRQVERSL